MSGYIRQAVRSDGPHLEFRVSRNDDRLDSRYLSVYDIQLAAGCLHRLVVSNHSAGSTIAASVGLRKSFRRFAIAERCHSLDQDHRKHCMTRKLYWCTFMMTSRDRRVCYCSVIKLIDLSDKVYYCSSYNLQFNFCTATVQFSVGTCLFLTIG